ncbi:hypothetical protein OSTOST_10460 [Ostertagia ostertagi]
MARIITAAFAGIALALGVAATAMAQNAAPAKSNFAPTKTVTIIVPYSPGGGTDAVGRLMAKALEEKWGQTVIVDNRTGGNGSVGAALVARAQPDGHTMVLAVSGIAINAHLMKLPYDTATAFAPGHRRRLSGRNAAGDARPAGQRPQGTGRAGAQGRTRQAHVRESRPGQPPDGRAHLRQRRHQAAERALQGRGLVRGRHLRRSRRCRHRQRHLGPGPDQRRQAEGSGHHGHAAHPRPPQRRDLQGAGLLRPRREFLVRPVRAGRHAAGHRRRHPEGYRERARGAGVPRQDHRVRLAARRRYAGRVQRTFQRDIKESGETIRRLGMTAD